jgi:hypothetical protein
MSTHVSLLGGLPLQISARKQAIMAGIFCFILSHTKPMLQLYLKLGHHHFTFFKVYYELIIPLFGSMRVNLFVENVVK